MDTDWIPALLLVKLLSRSQTLLDARAVIDSYPPAAAGGQLPITLVWDNSGWSGGDNALSFYEHSDTT
jgi:hypothetical protein